MTRTSVLALAVGAVAALLGRAAPVPPGLPVAPPPRPATPDISLVLVEEVVTPGSGVVDERRVLRVGVRNGRLQPAETVWQGHQRFLGHFGGHRLVADRYLVTNFGGVIDVTRGRVVSPEESGEFIAVDGTKVVYRVGDGGDRDGGIYTFDILKEETRLEPALAKGKFGLVGVRSPDGEKAVYAGPAGDELILHRVGVPPKSLGKGFVVEVGPLSSSFGPIPVLWLDDGRILTQVKNGELVAVTPDGKRAPVVKFPARRDLVGAPTLARDPGGRVIYECGGDGFVVDVKAGKWAKCEWIDLGHGFEASWKADEKGHVVRHKGKEIAHCWCWPRWPGRVAVADGYLALVVNTGEPPFASGTGEEVHIWSEKGGEWSALKLWPNCLVGWVK